MRKGRDPQVAAGERTITHNNSNAPRSTTLPFHGLLHHVVTDCGQGALALAAIRRSAWRLLASAAMREAACWFPTATKPRSHVTTYAPLNTTALLAA